MSAVFRRRPLDPIEVSDGWALDVQIEDASRWLQNPKNAEQVRDSILDIGFNTRPSEKVAVQGETIPLKFMQQLVDLGITLWLSIYPPLVENQISD